MICADAKRDKDESAERLNPRACPTLATPLHEHKPFRFSQLAPKAADYTATESIGIFCWCLAIEKLMKFRVMMSSDSQGGLAVLRARPFRQIGPSKHFVKSPGKQSPFVLGQGAKGRQTLRAILSEAA